MKMKIYQGEYRQQKLGNKKIEKWLGIICVVAILIIFWLDGPI